MNFLYLNSLSEFRFLVFASPWFLFASLAFYLAHQQLRQAYPGQRQTTGEDIKFGGIKITFSGIHFDMTVCCICKLGWLLHSELLV
ncbi:hypothetical protein HDK77DRAFT_73205 [Phyllosticta capitalensis]|uniref:Uncharacterized protein n=1 Tax=Phyllosticta capitalensis TaxID=121624 RepID=A0ABR1YQG4_9PEZI